MAQQKYDEAEKLNRQTIETAPTNGMYHANLAECLLEQNQKDAAMTEAKKAVELGFKEPCPAYTALGLNPQWHTLLG